MNILVTGGNGQLGMSIKDLAHSFGNYSFIFTDIDELDITDLKALQQFFSDHSIDVILNCAAYTAVDKAETEYDKALMINRDAVQNLVFIANDHDVSLIHVSTDYVFDGRSKRPYLETDPVSPTSAYGRSKVAGEEIILERSRNAAIVRTAWLYSPYGQNFVKTILKKGKEQGVLRVVADQLGSPTSAADLASAILHLANNMPEEGVQIYHYANEGVCSWYEFAKAVLDIGNIACKVHPVKSEDYPVLAPRPAYSVMDKSKIQHHLRLTVPAWRESLEICIDNMMGQ